MLLLGLLLIVGFTSCDLLFGDSSGGEDPSDEKEWTIMVWLDGDNDLNSNAVVDFHEMEYGLYQAGLYDSDFTEHLNIIVQYDQNDSYDLSSSTQGRYRVLPRNVDPTVYSTATTDPADTSIKLQSLNEPNMGSAAELATFIEYSKTNYPAENYALILWNHGGGVRSTKDTGGLSREICTDETDDDDLYIGEIKDYLSSSHSVDFLGMDACLMGFLEVAYEFRPGTGDFGAQTISFSPATEQGDGWEYDDIFSRMSGKPGTDENGHPYYSVESLTAQNFATIVAQEYEDSWSTNTTQTQTALDLTKINTVMTRLNAFAESIQENQSTAEGTYRNTDGIPYFDYSDDYEWYAYAAFDLYELAMSANYHAPSDQETLKSAATNLMTAIEDAILYSFGGSAYDSFGVDGFDAGKNGLAVFFPDGDSTFDPFSDGGGPFWSWQHWYNGATHAQYVNWWQNDLSQSSTPVYGALDFCVSDGDGNVETWFELLQHWFNPGLSSPNYYNPSPLE